MEVPPCISLTSQNDHFFLHPSESLWVDHLVTASISVFFQYCGLNVHAWVMEAFYKTDRRALVAIAC